MRETAVIYKSFYGSARQYATWIAEATGAKLFKREDANLADLSDCDTVVYVGGLYAGGIAGFGWIRRHYLQLGGKNLVVVAVGSAHPGADQRKEIMRRNFPTPMIENKVRLYALRGDLDYTVMSPPHRLMMKGLVTALKRKAPEKRTADEQAVIDSYGGVIRQVNRDAVIPITLHIKNIKAGIIPSDD